MYEFLIATKNYAIQFVLWKLELGIEEFWGNWKNFENLVNQLWKFKENLENWKSPWKSENLMKILRILEENPGNWKNSRNLE